MIHFSKLGWKLKPRKSLFSFMFLNLIHYKVDEIKTFYQNYEGTKKALFDQRYRTFWIQHLNTWYLQCKLLIWTFDLIFAIADFLWPLIVNFSRYIQMILLNPSQRIISSDFRFKKFTNYRVQPELYSIK